MRNHPHLFLTNKQTNSAGVYFNDCTKLVVDPSGRHARYIERSSSSSSTCVLLYPIHCVFTKSILYYHSSSHGRSS